MTTRRNFFTGFLFFKAIFAILILLLINSIARAQVTVTNHGQLINISNGSFIHINGSYVNRSVPTPTTAEPLSGKAAYVSGLNSQLIVTDSIANYNDTSLTYSDEKAAYMVLGALEVVFKGDRSQRIAGTTPIKFFKLTVDKSLDSIKLFQDTEVRDTLTIMQGNVHLNHHNIYLNRISSSENGTLVGENPANRISDHLDGRGTIYTIIDNFSPLFSQNIAGLGLFIDGAGTSFEKSTIIRGHGKQGGVKPEDGGPGDGSILRYYQVIVDDSQPAPTIMMTYFDNELDGNTENTLDFWASQDEGIIWNKFGGTGDPVANTFTAIDLPLDTTRFTLSPITCTNPPVIAISSDTLYLCDGKDATLDAGNPGMIFQWSLAGNPSFIETTQTIVVYEAGNYIVRVKDAKGCVSKDSMRVIDANNPVAFILPVIPVCLGDTTKFYTDDILVDPGEPGPLSYHWNFGTPTNDISNAKDTLFVYKTSEEFDITLEITNMYGCKNVATEVAEVLPIPIADFSIDNLCEGKLAEFNNQSTISSGGIGYEWNLGDGTSLQTDADPNHNYSSSGAYPVRLIVTSNGGCKDTADKIVNVYPVPMAGFTVSGDCQGDPVLFTNISTVNPPAPMTFKWNFDDGTASIAEGFSPGISKTYTGVGVSHVSLIATSTEGCADTIQPSPPVMIRNCNVDCSLLTPSVNLSPDRELCDGEDVLLDAGAQLPGTTYQWSDGTTGRTLLVNSQGTYSVAVISVDGCLGYSETDVHVTPKFNISLGGDRVLCSASGIDLSPVISRTGTFTYNWGSDQGITGSASSIETTLPGKYWVTVNDLSGCGFFDRDTVEIRSTTNTMHAEFLVKSDVTVGDKLVFVQLSHPDPENFSWNFGDLVTSTEPQPVKSYALPGTYKVLLTVGNSVCSDTLSKTIIVKLPPVIKGTPSADPSMFDNIRFVILPEPDIYPNPTDGMFTYELKLETEAMVDIQLYSMQGIVLASKRVYGSSITEHFDISGQVSGMYLIRTILNNQFVVNKIIKL